MPHTNTWVRPTPMRAMIFAAHDLHGEREVARISMVRFSFSSTTDCIR